MQLNTVKKFFKILTIRQVGVMVTKPIFIKIVIFLKMGKKITSIVKETAFPNAV